MKLSTRMWLWFFSVLATLVLIQFVIAHAVTQGDLQYFSIIALLAALTELADALEKRK